MEKEIYERYFLAIIAVGSEITSKKYALLAIDTILRSLESDFKALQNIKTTDQGISFDDGFNSGESEEQKKALLEFHRVFIKSFPDLDELKRLIRNSLDHDTLDKLNVWGLEI